MIEQLLALSELSAKDQEYFLPKFYCSDNKPSCKTIIHTIRVLKKFNHLGIKYNYHATADNTLWFSVEGNSYIRIGDNTGFIKFFTMPINDDDYYHNESDDVEDFFDNLDVDLIKERSRVG